MRKILVGSILGFVIAALVAGSDIGDAIWEVRDWGTDRTTVNGAIGFFGIVVGGFLGYLSKRRNDPDWSLSESSPALGYIKGVVTGRVYESGEQGADPTELPLHEEPPPPPDSASSN